MQMCCLLSPFRAPFLSFSFLFPPHGVHRSSLSSTALRATQRFPPSRCGLHTLLPPPDILFLLHPLRGFRPMLRSLFLSPFELLIPDSNSSESHLSLLLSLSLFDSTLNLWRVENPPSFTVFLHFHRNSHSEDIQMERKRVLYSVHPRPFSLLHFPPHLVAFLGVPVPLLPPLPHNFLPFQRNGFEPGGPGVRDSRSPPDIPTVFSRVPFLSHRMCCFANGWWTLLNATPCPPPQTFFSSPYIFHNQTHHRMLRPQYNFSPPYLPLSLPSSFFFENGRGVFCSLGTGPAFFSLRV